MLKPLRAILIALILFCALLSPDQARADAAPLELPGGAALDPGEAATQVRMVAETVTLVVTPPNQEPYIEARVNADFTFRNLGDTPEQILVGFPLTCDWCMVDENRWPEEIEDLTIYVNSLQITTRREVLTFHTPNELLSVSWAVFDVTFPPGQDVFIRATYTTGGWGFRDYSYRTFSYVLITGAGWYDTIGSVDIIARLPYAANELNTWIDQSGLTGESPTMIPAISGNELRWHFDELEPTKDFELTIVHPWQWFSILVEEENVRLNPQDGEAWGRLGRAYKQLLRIPKHIRDDPDSETIYSRAVEAYERATTILPNDALWHAGFAELLYLHFYFVDYTGNYDRPAEDLSDLVKAVDEVRRSLEIDPENELALDILSQVKYEFPDAVKMVRSTVDYPILTSTAGYSYTYWHAPETPSPTRTPRLPITPHPTRTPKPTATPEIVASSTDAPTQGDQIPAPQSAAADQMLLQATSTPAESSSAGGVSPLWIGGILLLLIIGLVWLLRRKHA